MRFILLFLCCLPRFVHGQKTTEVIVYYEVDNDTITESNRNSIIKERYEVLKHDKKIRHGKYRRFSKLMDLVEEGNYKNNVKTGIWTMYRENGYVRERFDFDKMLSLDTSVLLDRIFAYPMKYLLEMEQNDTIELKSGKVVLQIGFDADCALVTCELTKTSYDEFNKIALDGFRAYVRLMRQYGKEIPECKAGKKEIAIFFGDNK